MHDSTDDAALTSAWEAELAALKARSERAADLVDRHRQTHGPDAPLVFGRIGPVQTHGVVLHASTRGEQIQATYFDEHGWILDLAFSSWETAVLHVLGRALPVLDPEVFERLVQAWATAHQKHPPALESEVPDGHVS